MVLDIHIIWIIETCTKSDLLNALSDHGDLTDYFNKKFICLDNWMMDRGFIIRFTWSKLRWDDSINDESNFVVVVELFNFFNIFLYHTWIADCIRCDIEDWYQSSIEYFIWSNMYQVMELNLMKFDEIWWNLMKFDEIWWNLMKFKWTLWNQKRRFEWRRMRIS